MLIRSDILIRLDILLYMIYSAIGMALYPMKSVLILQIFNLFAANIWNNKMLRRSWATRSFQVLVSAGMNCLLCISTVLGHMMKWTLYYKFWNYRQESRTFTASSFINAHSSLISNILKNAMGEENYYHTPHFIHLL